MRLGSWRLGLPSREGRRSRVSLETSDLLTPCTPAAYGLLTAPAVRVRCYGMCRGESFNDEIKPAYRLVCGAFVGPIRYGMWFEFKFKFKFKFKFN